MEKPDDFLILIIHLNISLKRRFEDRNDWGLNPFSIGGESESKCQRRIN